MIIRNLILWKKARLRLNEIERDADCKNLLGACHVYPATCFGVNLTLHFLSSSLPSRYLQDIFARPVQYQTGYFILGNMHHPTYRVVFFNCSHPKISKCQPVSKLGPKKYQNCSHPKKNKERKKLEYPNCSHPSIFLNINNFTFFR